jgi:hypothetical protein
MATNKEILDAYVRQDELRDTVRELELAVKNAQKKLEKAKAELFLADAVDDIVDGVAIEVTGDTEDFFDMNTLACGPQIMPRDVHGYKVAWGGENWAVRLNGGHGDRRLFLGGEVVGLNRKWTRSEALEVAKRWLTGDESALVA